MGSPTQIYRRRALHEKQNGLCHYCGVKMTHGCRTRDGLTFDHVIPRCQGGTWAEDNIVGACWACNNARGNTPYAEFKEHVAEHGRPNRQFSFGQNAREYLERRIAKAETRRRAREAASQVETQDWDRVKRPT